MAGMLTTIGVVKEDAQGEKVLTISAKEAFLESVREKLTQPVGTCVGLPVGIINFLASESIADSFYNPDSESYAQNNARNNGWHAIWIPAYEKPVVNGFDQESAQVFKTIMPQFWIGDPTEAIALVLNEIKASIEEFISDIDAFMQEYLIPIINTLGEIVPILVKMLSLPFEGFKELIEYLAKIFEPAGEEIVKKIEQAMKDKKEQLIEKIVKVLTGLPKIPKIEIPTLETILDYLGIEFDPPIDVNLQIPSLLFPGIFPIVPPGIVAIILKTIVAIFEEIIAIMAGVSSLFNLKWALGFIMRGDFLGLISGLILRFVNFIIEKIREFVPQIDGMVVFICSILAYLEKMIQLAVLVVIGHLIGPGLILQHIADIMDIL